MAALAKLQEALLQPLAHGLGQPEMEGGGDESRSIRTLGQVVAETLVHKVSHALGGCLLLHTSLQPAVAFHLRLPFHHPQGTVALDVFGTCLHHHTAVRPLSTAVAGTHAIDHYLLFARGGGDDKTAGTHTERVDPSTIHLSDKRIFSCWQIFAPALLVVIL